MSSISTAHDSSDIRHTAPLTTQTAISSSSYTSPNKPGETVIPVAEAGAEGMDKGEGMGVEAADTKGTYSRENKEEEEQEGEEGDTFNLADLLWSTHSKDIADQSRSQSQSHSPSDIQVNISCLLYMLNVYNLDTYMSTCHMYLVIT